MRLAVLFSLIFVSSTFVGCLGVEDEDKFTWPEKKYADCSLTTEYDLVCETYLNLLSYGAPIASLHYEPLDEIWVAYLDGNILGYNGDTVRPVGNLSSIISRCHYEQGLLGMVFVEGQDFGKILISYIENDICEESHAAPLVLAEINLENHILYAEYLTVLEKIEQPYRNHNGGYIIYAGNNEYLWGIGDGGSSGDPHKNGQNESTPLGSIRHIDYTNDTYESKTLHYGLRNPWRFDIDSKGGLWIGDVGQTCFEEVNFIEKWNESTNFGWSTREGSHEFNLDCTSPRTVAPDGITDPLLEYPHTGGDCSVTGGFWMDWGPSDLQNGYLYGDFCTGTMWLAKNESGVFTEKVIANTEIQITGFGRGLNDELLIFDWGGKIVKLEEIQNPDGNS